MYWWNYRALANDLKNNAVSKDSVIGYSVLFAIWMIYNVFLLLSNTEQSPHDDSAATFFNYAYWVVPIAVAYYINRQGDNAAFMKRYVCLFLPIFVRMLLLSLIFIPVFVLYILSCFMQRGPELIDVCFAEKLNTPMFIVIVVIVLAYNVYLNIKAFRIAAGKEAAQREPRQPPHPQAPNPGHRRRAWRRQRQTEEGGVLMYWWNYKKLALALREGTVKPWQCKVYWAFFVVVYLLVLAAYIDMKLPADSTINIFYNYVVTIIGLIVLVVLTFQINQSGDKNDYLKRLACLNFPICIRSLVIFTIPLLLVYFIQFGLRLLKACPNMEDEEAFYACYFPQMESLAEPTFIDLGLYVFVFVVWIYWYRKAFRIAAGKEVTT